MSKPTQKELERAHQCMSAMRDALKQAMKHGGPNAKAHAGDLVRVIDSFKINPDGEASKEVTGPFYPTRN